MRFAAVAATTAVALMVALGATEVAGVPTGARSDGFRTQRSDSAVADVADSRFARVDNSTGENTTEGVAEAAESGAAPGGNATAPAPHQPNTTAPVPAAANTNTVEEATPVASDSPADEAPVEEPLVLLFDDEHRPGPDLPPSCKDHDITLADESTEDYLAFLQWTDVEALYQLPKWSKRRIDQMPGVWASKIKSLCGSVDPSVDFQAAAPSRKVWEDELYEALHELTVSCFHQANAEEYHAAYLHICPQTAPVEEKQETDEVPGSNATVAEPATDATAVANTTEAPSSASDSVEAEAEEAEQEAEQEAEEAKEKAAKEAEEAEKEAEEAKEEAKKEAEEAEKEAEEVKEAAKKEAEEELAKAKKEAAAIKEEAKQAAAETDAKAEAKAEETEKKAEATEEKAEAKEKQAEAEVEEVVEEAAM